MCIVCIYICIYTRDITPKPVPVTTGEAHLRYLAPRKFEDESRAADGIFMPRDKIAVIEEHHLKS